jgi:hypothetical protein
VIIPRLKKIFAKSDPALGYFSGELLFWLGWRQARKELESFLKEQPKNYLLIGDLALTDMGLGDRTAALALAERAMAVNPIEKDTLTGPVPIEILARVAAWTGGTRPRHHRFYKNCSRCRTLADWLWARSRLLRRCFSSIQRSIRFGMIRASRSLLPRPRRNRPVEAAVSPGVP